MTLRCSGPEAVSGRAVSTLTSEEFVCETDGANIALIVGLTVLGIAVAAAFVFVIYKFSVSCILTRVDAGIRAVRLSKICWNKICLKFETRVKMGRYSGNVKMPVSMVG